MKLLKSLVIAAVVLLSASMFTGCMMMMASARHVSTANYENPQWAPPYYSGARYYYLPDLELYYDLATREYIFLMDGRWNYSPYVPAIYRNYDLNNSFSVVLNVDVYRPWLHHQYYASHYPRYYYRDYYDRSNIPYVRAYNENLRRAVYWNVSERSRARPWNDENLRDNRRFKYSTEDKREQKNQTQPNQGTGTFGGQPRGEQQNNATQTRTTTRTETTTQPRTTIRTETTPQPRTSTRTETTTQPRPETKTRSESTTQTETRTPATTRTTTTTTRQTSTNNETAPVRNNQTNYYGKTIGNSVRVTKQMKDNTPATRTSRQTDPSR